MKLQKTIAELTVLLVVLLLPCVTIATNIIFETPLGSFEVELFDNETPGTVTNFLKYVNDGNYDNSFIHRSAKDNSGQDFVIQGGGFTFIDGTYGDVLKNPPIQNEFNRSNTRGTIAMAKLGGDPDSATSEWFINLADNSANLDNQNGGFTVFGRVIGDGMTVVDAIAALARWDFSSTLGGAFGDLPLIGDPDVRPNDTEPQLEELVMVDISVVTTDEDNDGVLDDVDNCPAIANAGQEDNDNDDQGDACDEDDDNDNLSDTEEANLGTDPFNADTDGDGVKDGAEVNQGRNPLVNEAVILLIITTD